MLIGLHTTFTRLKSVLGNQSGNYIFIELVPRPIQSISHNVRGYVNVWILPFVGDWNQERWRLLFQECIAKVIITKKTDPTSLCLPFAHAVLPTIGNFITELFVEKIGYPLGKYP